MFPVMIFPAEYQKAYPKVPELINRGPRTASIQHGEVYTTNKQTNKH